MLVFHKNINLDCVPKEERIASIRRPLLAWGLQLTPKLFLVRTLLLFKCTGFD